MTESRLTSQRRSVCHKRAATVRYLSYDLSLDICIRLSPFYNGNIFDGWQFSGKCLHSCASDSPMYLQRGDI